MRKCLTTDLKDSIKDHAKSKESKKKKVIFVNSKFRYYKLKEKSENKLRTTHSPM